jgi:tRNA modification GTPase
MRFALNDTIAAPATPAGTSALAVIRISGPEAIELTAAIFSKPEKLLQAAGYNAVHGYITDAGAALDEVVCLVFRAPHSYTGEDMVELTCHGNPDLTSRILQLILKRCRPAEPGEFTFRAFINNKLDLAQAEAVGDLIHARTGRAETAALDQLRGKLSQELASLLDELSDCRMRFELSLDFADQDLPEPDLDAVAQRLQKVRFRLAEMLAGGRQGRILRDGFSICLSGAPNVGKSSVFNKFLAENRALVTPVPGTTRDYLEEWLALEGFPVRLWDTAGLRETSDRVEQLGIDRTLDLMQKADLIILLTDPDTLDQGCCRPDALHAAKTLCVLNKTDLLGFDKLPSEAEWTAYLQGSRFAGKLADQVKLIPCSAALEDGIARLRAEIVSRLSQPGWEASAVLVTNTRHLALLERALASLDKALTGIAAAAGYEFIAFDILEASSALSEITGAVTTDDLLDRIFSNFCIGK